MKKIVTISRSFSSGGREVGKRLAQELGFAYYDKQLLKEISNETGFTSEYIEKYGESAAYTSYPITIAQTFITPFQMPNESIQIAQTKIVREIGDKGDCVIIGRRGDRILKDKENLLKVFIYSSDMDERIKRCYDKSPDDKDKSPEFIKKKIISIDKDRAKYYRFYSDQNWGEMNNYNLFIDTSKISIKKAVQMIILAMD
ncbi:MAG: cytidylate kinase-like family protein [Clostridia bacterium]